ncbi:MAG: hypothetical protein ACT4QF_00630 [Sporichthyaceae bacterium]
MRRSPAIADPSQRHSPLTLPLLGVSRATGMPCAHCGAPATRGHGHTERS